MEKAVLCFLSIDDMKP